MKFFAIKLRAQPDEPIRDEFGETDLEDEAATDPSSDSSLRPPFPVADIGVRCCFQIKTIF